jgi:hypothetical protein
MAYNYECDNEEWGMKPEIHPKLSFLLDRHVRYKGAYGGRAGRKSYSFADAYLARMTEKRTNIVIGREFEATIRDSVHRLLKNRIEYHRLQEIYNVNRDSITNLCNSSILTYRYLHDNYSDVKGLEDVDIFGIFEAEKWTRESYNFIYPTIRKEGSEIWAEWNPENDDDFVMEKYIYRIDHSDTICAEVLYLDNPYLSDDVRKEAEKCKRDFPDEYEHIWLGKPSKVGSKIYPMFTKEHHIIYGHDLDENFENSMYFNGQDPATKYYPFCVWIKRIHKGDGKYKYIVYNEFPTVDMMKGQYFYEYRDTKVCELTLKQRAGLFRIFDNTTPKGIFPRVVVEDKDLAFSHRAVDTRFAKASGAASTTLGGTKGMIITWALPENGAMRFNTPPERMIDVQCDVIREAMSYDTTVGWIPGFNEASWYVMPHCHNVIDACLFHRMDNDKKTEHPKRKDVMDAIRICHAYMAQIPHKSLVKVEDDPLFLQQLHGVDKAKELQKQFEKRSIYA